MPIIFNPYSPHPWVANYTGYAPAQRRNSQPWNTPWPILSGGSSPYTLVLGIDFHYDEVMFRRGF